MKLLWLAIAASFFSMVGHYLAFGPKTSKDGAAESDGGAKKGDG